MSNLLTATEWDALSELLAQGEYWVDYKETDYSDGESFEYEIGGRWVDARELLRLAYSGLQKCASFTGVNA